MVLLAKQFVGESHMVAVVVCYEYAADTLEVYAVVTHSGFHCVRIYTGVDKYAFFAIAEIGAIARRSTAEGYEHQSVGG